MCRHNENLCGPPEPKAGLGKVRNELALSACALVPRHAVYAVIRLLVGRWPASGCVMTAHPRVYEQMMEASDRLMVAVQRSLSHQPR